MSTLTTTENAFQAASYGGIVTIVLAIIALSGVYQTMLLAVAIIVFGAALLIQGGTMLSEYTRMIFPAGATGPVEEFGAGGGLFAVFLVAAAGIMLGVLALLGIFPLTLVAVSIIAFGAALVLSSNSVWQLYTMKRTAHRVASGRMVSGGEILAWEMASGSAAMQCLTGLAAIVLGILAVTGTDTAILSLIGLLVLGATVLLTGGTLSSAVMGFMEPTSTRPSGSNPSAAG
jgi:hypothetical protein